MIIKKVVVFLDFRPFAKRSLRLVLIFVFCRVERYHLVIFMVSVDLE